MSTTGSFTHLRHSRAFTLIEVMISTVLLLILMAMIFSITASTGKIWQNTNKSINSFQEARTAFEAITKILSHATLDPYYDYYSNQENRFCDTVNPPDKADSYKRRSGLHFVIQKAATLPGKSKNGWSIFFQAPLGVTSDTGNYRGLDQILNACGFFVEFGEDETRPSFLSALSPSIPPRFRYRLISFVEPSEKLRIYSTPSDTSSAAKGWFLNSLEIHENRRVIAENIVAVVFMAKRPRRGSDVEKTPLVPFLTHAGGYEYDSRTLPGKEIVQTEESHQLPPVIQVTLVAIDESSASLLNPPKGSQQASNLVPESLFVNPLQYEKDIQLLEEILMAKKGNLAGNKIRCRYHIFTTDVMIRSAKWSR